MSDDYTPDNRRHSALAAVDFYPRAPLGAPTPRNFGAPVYVSPEIAAEIAAEAFKLTWASTNPADAAGRVQQVLAAGRPPVPNVDELAIWRAYEARR